MRTKYSKLLETGLRLGDGAEPSSGRQMVRKGKAGATQRGERLSSGRVLSLLLQRLAVSI